MRDRHAFSKSYENRKKAIRQALHEELLITEMGCKERTYTLRKPVKILASAALISVLSLGVYAATQWVEFRMEQNGAEVHVHASLNETAKNTADAEEKPLRSWVSAEEEISVRLVIPDLPSDMSEDLTANGKYRSEDNSRSITINGIDLRRSDLDQLIGGAVATKQFDVGGKALYVITRGEAEFYNRIAYIVYEDDEFVLKLWVSYGITNDELMALASTLALEETTDALLAIPILNELTGNSNMDIPFVYTKDENPIYEADLLEIGESARDDNDWYTVTVDAVEVYDNINILDQNCILRKDFIERFTDASGKLVPYNRTEVILTVNDEKKATSQFGETTSVKKKLYVVTLTMDDVTMNAFTGADREEMLRACVNSFDLNAYTVTNGEMQMQSSNAVVDRKPNVYADNSEIIYREYLGNNQWKVAYLIDEDVAEGNLVLNNYSGKLYVKLQ